MSGTCAICLELLKFPVTLSCGHSLCKPCILGQNVGPHGVNILCPLCRAPSRFESEADMVVNRALQHSVDILRGAAVPQLPCQRCEATEATVDCSDCNAKYCSGCSDLVHIGKLKGHQLVYSTVAVHGTQKAPVCSEGGHESYRQDLYCSDCNVLLCVLCSQTTATHRSHNVVPLRQAAQVEAVKLRATLDAAAGFREELRKVSRGLDDTLVDCEQRAREEITQFDATMQAVIDYFQRKRAEVIDRAKTLTVDESLKIRRAKEQILSLATKLNDTMGACHRAVVLSADVDIITGRVEMERQLASQPPIVLPPVRVPQFHFPHYQALVASIDEISVSEEHPKHAPPAAVLEAASIFQERGFRFCKSTYNEVQLTNRGLTAMCSTQGWETVMADTLLTVGTHYWEVKLDRYDAKNGHNVVVGVVFDGGFELCEVLGEDSNSVGFNCGRGTKCVNGNFMEPYAQPCQQGDVIGLKLCYAQQSLEFFRNGRSMGVAFTGLARPCYAAVSLIQQQQVTLMFPHNVPAS